NVAEYFALFFVWSAHVVLDVQHSLQLPNRRIFPQPVEAVPYKDVVVATQALQPVGFGLRTRKADRLKPVLQRHRVREEIIEKHADQD
ncbi:MAG: hypothetical protein WCA19_08205, partial [Candidatus Acidiferrales bacterium]